ncbi:protein farnesyltransferase subunit beta-like [Uloborus diversus]|uniref:protein farnesyltransferase subunit beta-like n=1 Tax=Uloborus diversus TaxID=327109 RepID=UPI00240926A7|nr:protein farnesyltransferase subunit beta-like [Uloborus diversus]
MDDLCEEFCSRLRCLSPNFQAERYQDDNFETFTSVEQIEVESSVEKCIQVIKNLLDVDPKCPTLQREKHVQFLKKGLIHLPASLEVLDASRTWLCYWILHSIQLLDEPVTEETKFHVTKFLQKCQHPDGGFGGGPGQEAHLAPTYAAVNALCILRTTEAYNVIDREKLLNFLLRMRKPDGSFVMHEGSESDIRGVYCALSVAKLTNIWCPELIKGTAHWVSRCQTYEGGFGGVPDMEAHGGYTFCGFASLVLMGQENVININNLLRWLVHKQMKYEGGFQGRTNKLVDSCYSFWQGGIFPLIHRALCLTEHQTLSSENWLFNQEALQEYILINCQFPHGGLIDKPGKNKDYYHTCYSLSGLSVAQHFASGHIGKIKVIGDEDNELCPTHPVYNLCFQSALQAIQHFKSLPVPDLPEKFKNETL